MLPVIFEPFVVYQLCAVWQSLGSSRSKGFSLSFGDFVSTMVVLGRLSIGDRLRGGVEAVCGLSAEIVGFQVWWLHCLGRTRVHRHWVSGAFIDGIALSMVSRLRRSETSDF